MRRFWIIAAVVFVLDQLTKLAVVHGLDLINRGEIDVFPPYLTFRMAWNYGINFGLLSNGSDWARWGLIVLALAISAWVVWWMRREKGNWKAELSGGLLVGGALGNIIDRIAYGAVADFLNMSCCGIENPYAFNVADIAIFAGALGLVIFAKGSDGDKPTGGKPPRRSR
ncbi:signal peptidase II [Tabrizicola sp.]|uniref:signal peptidase II n=1 Tax=Tabrizicola sp. TaxID=2005166 RepID=UPI002732849A|nr:signal peptidase II [Tabrizicola sp.]MDP3197263.1 signal peptidase II [Tabrizicola sp.]MDZ4065441.1 signal peptidase II [Tabrizicola sp.]